MPIALQFEFSEIWIIISAASAGFALGYLVVFSNFYAFPSENLALGSPQPGRPNAGFAWFAHSGWGATSHPESPQEPMKAPLDPSANHNRSAYHTRETHDRIGTKSNHLPEEWFARFRDVLCPLLFALAAFCLALGCTLHFPPAYAFAGTVLGVGLLTLTMIDIRHFLLPDIFTGLLGLSGLVFLAWFDPDAMAVHALSGLLAFAVIAGLGEVYRRWRGHDGIGLGDAKLLAVAGIWLGPAALGPLLFLSALLALGFLIVARLSGRIVSRRTAIPFGAFLSPVMFALWCLQSVPD